MYKLTFLLVCVEWIVNNNILYFLTLFANRSDITLHITLWLFQCCLWQILEQNLIASHSPQSLKMDSKSLFLQNEQWGISWEPTDESLNSSVPGRFPSVDTPTYKSMNTCTIVSQTVTSDTYLTWIFYHYSKSCAYLPYYPTSYILTDLGDYLVAFAYFWVTQWVPHLSLPCYYLVHSIISHHIPLELTYSDLTCLL